MPRRALTRRASPPDPNGEWVVTPVRGDEISTFTRRRNVPVRSACSGHLRSQGYAPRAASACWTLGLVEMMPDSACRSSSRTFLTTEARVVPRYVSAIPCASGTGAHGHPTVPATSLVLTDRTFAHAARHRASFGSPHCTPLDEYVGPDEMFPLDKRCKGPIEMRLRSAMASMSCGGLPHGPLAETSVLFAVVLVVGRRCRRWPCRGCGRVVRWSRTGCW
jgi:hypothetical protein